MNKLAVVMLGVMVAACGKPDEDYKKQKPPEETAPAASETKAAPPPPAKKQLTEAEMGTCELEASGAITAKQTSPGSRTATNVSYWQSEAERGTMSAIEGFVVNCHGPEVKFSILPGGGKKDGMPFGPKKYEFKKGTGDANVMVTFGPKHTLGDASGTVDITRFDKQRITGTINLSGKVVPGNGNVKLTGTFDYACPGLSGCE